MDSYIHNIPYYAFFNPHQTTYLAQYINLNMNNKLLQLILFTASTKQCKFTRVNTKVSLSVPELSFDSTIKSTTASFEHLQRLAK